MAETGTYTSQSGEPTLPAELAGGLPPEDTSKWPKVIGIFSLFYAILGMFCGLATTTWALAGTAMLAGLMDADISMPMSLKIFYLTAAALGLILSIMLLTAAVGLLRRKSSGVRRHLRWALWRMLLILAASIAGLVTAPSNVQLEKAMAEAGNRMAEEQDAPTRPIPSDEALFRKTIIQTAIGSGVQIIYPLFIGFYLSRRKIRGQIAHWPSK